MEEQEFNNVYAIPANFTDSGKLFGGMVEPRNAIEALILILGGILERTVPSVALQIFLFPGSKLYPSRSIAAIRPFLEG